jgi:hypothetical protein
MFFANDTLDMLILKVLAQPRMPAPCEPYYSLNLSGETKTLNPSP